VARDAVAVLGADAREAVDAHGEQAQA